MTGVCPASSNAEAMVLPMYPAPPVMRIFMGWCLLWGKYKVKYEE